MNTYIVRSVSGRCCGIGRRRRGFTLVELMMASACTALVVTSGVAMTVAVGYAADATKRDGTAALQGHSAMWRLARVIRSARLIGFHDTNKIVLWRDDANGDDKVQLSETELYWYDGAQHRLNRTRPYDSKMTAAEIAPTDRSVGFAELSSSTYPNTIMASANAETAVLASNAADFKIKSNSGTASAGLFDLRLTTQEGSITKRMAVSASPRAAADYLLSGSTSSNDGVPTNRYRRTAPRTWTVPTGAAQQW